MELNKVIENKDYEKLVIENLQRCRRIVGKEFKVVFWHHNLKKSVINDFVKRNKSELFDLGTQITNKTNYTWFLIKSSIDEKSRWRYKWDGDPLEGIVEYIKVVSHIKKRGKNESSNRR